jgi:hypothetical protein
MTQLPSFSRSFRTAVAAAAMVTVPLAPGCSCGVLTALAGLEEPPPSPVVNPLPAITNALTLPVSGTTAPRTAVDAEVVGRGPFRLRALEEGEAFAGTLELVEGDNTIFVAATNGAGTPSTPVGPLVVVLDTVAPDAPAFVDPPASVAVGPGGAPAESVLQVTSGADCILDVTLNGAPLAATAITADDGGFVVAVDLPVGSNAIGASCRDAAGNSSDTTAITIEVVVDATAPAPPVVNPFTAPLVFEAPATTASLALTGSKAAGTLLVIDGQAQAAIGAGETWQLDLTLEEGDHVLLLATQNALGTRSEAVSVAVPTRERPVAPLPDPIAGLTNQTTFSMTGTRCAVGTQIFAATTAEGAGDVALAGTCEAFQVGGVEVGRFTVRVTLQEGANDIYLYAQRDLGVQSRRVGPLNVTLDTVAPAAPVITFPSCAAAAPRTCNAIIGAGETSGVFSLSGTRDAADDVNVNGEVTPAGDVLFSADVTVQASAASTTITVRTVDAAGNESEPVVVTVVPVAGLAAPTLQCLGPYRFSGSLAACPILNTAIPASRRAVRGGDITLRGTVAVAGQQLRVCAVPASRGAVDDPCAPAPDTIVVNAVVASNRSFVAQVPASVLAGGTNFFIQSSAAAAVSAFVGPNVVRRDDTAPASPSGLALSDVDGPLQGTPPTTRLLDVSLAGIKDIDGDVCLRQALVSDTCPGGVCAFTPCLLLAGADGLTAWSGAVRLRGGQNRLCVESSDVVPFDGEVSNPSVGAGERQFVGNVSAEACIDVSVSVDPGPAFIQPLEDALVRPGRFVAKVEVDDPLDATTGVDICVEDDPCVAATEDVENGVWQAEVQLPSGSLGDEVDLRALAKVGNDVRGAPAVVTARLIPPQQLVSATGDIVADDFMIGRVAPRVAGGISGELIAVWEDDCMVRSSPACTVRNTSNALQNTGDKSIFVRRMVAGAWQRIVNVSDDVDAADGTEPVIAVDRAGFSHLLWIDNGFDDAEGTLVHRTLSADLVPLAFSPTVEVTSDLENENGRRELDFRPSIATGPGGETAVAWVKQRDAVEGPEGEGTRYVAFAVYCSNECENYASQAARSAGVWSAAVQISPQITPTPLDNPAIALDAESSPERKAWVAWNLRQGTNQLLQIRDVPLDPAVATPINANCQDLQTASNCLLTIPATGVVAASRPTMAMDPSGILHIVWNASDGVRYTSLDTVPDSGFRTFSPVLLLAAHETDALAATADVIAPAAGRAVAFISMIPRDDFCFAQAPTGGSVRQSEIVGGAVTTTSVVAARSSLAPRAAVLAGGSAAIVYEVDACAESGDIASNSFLDVIPLP